MERLQLVCFFFACAGVFLVYFFSPEQMYSDFKECSGLVKAEGTLIKAFFSSKGNYIGILDSGEKIFMVMIDYSLKKGDEIEVYAKASDFQGQCWLFPDKVVLK